MFQRMIGCVAIVASAVAAFAGHGGGYSGGQAQYDQVKSGSYAFSAGSGGEFRLRDAGTGMTLSTAAYASVTKDLKTSGPDTHWAGSFQTFCIEADEGLKEPMDLWVSTENVDESTGVPNGPGSHAWNGGANTNKGDNLSTQTAYMYYLFATGNLTSYNYTQGSSRARSAATLQRVLWILEDEGGSNLSVSFGGISLTSAERNQANAWLSLANTANGGLYGVRVLQTYALSGGRAQDQLYLTAVPVPGAVLLAVLGLAGVRLFHRK